MTRQIGITLDAASFESFDLDLDLNGTDDFVFETAYINDPGFLLVFDQVSAAGNLFGTNSGVLVDMATGDGFPTVTRLGFGSEVSSAFAFSSASDIGNLFSTDSFNSPSGNFGGQSGFVGLRFVREAETFFGFAQVTVFALDDAVNPSGLFIGQVGYNDTPGESVVAVPEPAAASLFAAGLTTVFALHRIRRRSSPQG